MRGLAEYVMVGRRQAIIIVLLCGFFPLLYFLSAAVVGLVTLRRGQQEGLLVLLWSLLPTGTLWSMGDSSPVFLMLGTYVLALVLRRTESWQLVILLAIGLGLLTQASLLIQPEYRAQVEQVVNEGLQAQLNQAGQAEYTAEQVVDLLLSFYGAYHAFMVTICMMISRSWQAKLYNPGGFRQEFHLLRFDPRVMILLLGLILAGLLDIPPLDGLLPLFSVAPMIAGLAIAHWIVAKKKLGTPWLVLCYLTLFMMAPAIILLGLADSVLDLRRRLDRQDD
jgi:hypothetical protein